MPLYYVFSTKNSLEKKKEKGKEKKWERSILCINFVKLFKIWSLGRPFCTVSGDKEGLCLAALLHYLTNMC